MSNFKESHEININEEDQVIKFTRTSQRGACEHKLVEISEEDDEILCKDCNVRLNPIVWISKHLKKLNAVTRRNNAILAEYREIEKKLSNKNKFMCTYCHEVNTINFHKLPSQAAVKRGMSVVDEDYKGMVVEIKS